MREVSVSFLSKEKPSNLIKKINDSHADYIHFDVMDGKFVPNKFLTIKEMQDLVGICKKKIDVHLMTINPEKYIKALSLYDISYITIHFEIKDCRKYINMIKEYGFKVGISIKPSTAIEEIFPILDQINLVLLMSVEPGASGQSFIIDTKDKITLLKEEINKRKLLTKISVDGGINEEVISYLSDADILVSASYVLDDLTRINNLK